jgi:histone H4
MRVLRDTHVGISKGDIRRLARRGGVRRIRWNDELLIRVRLALKEFVRRVLKSAITYTEHSRRWTVSQMDIVCGLKREGITVYGIGDPHQ